MASTVVNSDWFPERDALAQVGMSWETLRKMRRDADHVDGWRYRPSKKGMSKAGRTIRSGVQWSKKYLEALYKKAA